jgi:hypothetical protein
MTLIVSPYKYPSKKSFKEAVHENPENVYVEDPSIFGEPISGSIAFVVGKKGSITVTNHPKRSWFAKIDLKTKGKFKDKIRVS